jgi:hypothetical protein
MLEPTEAPDAARPVAGEPGIAVIATRAVRTGMSSVRRAARRMAPGVAVAGRLRPRDRADRQPRLTQPLQLELAVVAYIGWCNDSRHHQPLGDRPPSEFERPSHSSTFEIAFLMKRGNQPIRSPRNPSGSDRLPD